MPVALRERGPAPSLPLVSALSHSLSVRVTAAGAAFRGIWLRRQPQRTQYIAGHGTTRPPARCGSLDWRPFARKGSTELWMVTGAFCIRNPRGSISHKDNF